MAPRALPASIAAPATISPLSATKLLMFPPISLIPCNAHASVRALARREVYASTLWVRASRPAVTATDLGSETNINGSSRAVRARPHRLCRMLILAPLTESVIEAVVDTSEPVPAVLGSASNGAGGV